MAIVNLKTNLRTLKYTNLESTPYVRQPLPQDYEKSPVLLDPKTGDALLMGRMMNSVPGTTFLVNQAILGEDPSRIVKILGSTLAQVAVNGTGTHLIRGFDPEVYEKDGYGDVAGGLTRSGGRGEIRVQRASKLRREGSGTLEKVEGKPGQMISTSGVKILEPIAKQEGEAFEILRTESMGYHLNSGAQQAAVEKAFKDRKYEDTALPMVQGTYIVPKQYDSTGNEIPTLDSKLRFDQKGNKDDADVKILSVENEEEISDLLQADLIPFEFQTITPKGRKALYFRAFLGDFNDNFGGTWGKEKYIGRAEEFLVYQGFNRSVNFTLQVVAFNESHLQPMYNKLNALVGATAPTYNETGQFMRGTLGRITIGDYFRRQYGIFEKVDISWKQDYLWEIESKSSRTGKDLIRVPQMLDISINFIPIHTFNVQEGQRFFG